MRQVTGELFGIVGRRRGTGTEVLLLRGPGGWSLPRLHHRDPPAAHAEIAGRFGLTVTTRDCLEQRDTQAGATARYYVHEVHTDPAASGAAPHGAAATPHGPAESRWFGAAGLAGADLDPDQRRVLERWFADATATAPASGRETGGGLPWTREGWYATAAAWADEQLRRAGNTPVGAPEQPFLRVWSFQLRIPVAHGAAYFKASPPVFGHEAEVTRLLSDRFPDSIPRVLAIDAQRHWMLTDDFGPVHRPASAEAVEGYARMVPQLATIQRFTEGHARALGAAGCPDHRTARLPELLAELIEDNERLESAERHRLADYVPHFRDLCAELESAGVPDSLVHLDIWRGNFTDRDTGPLLFDWAESVLGHPFISLDVALRDLRSAAPGDESAVRRVTDAYLRQWSGIAPMERLVRAARLAATAGIVSRALLWQDALKGLDPERARPYAGTVAAQLRELPLGSG
ncbi:phosphotransferase family protein [Streptomyces sp. NPDC048257]|uniref:phosphotransferase family protein n=1 Tax=Streptomyces sp. NPDC048257 TaxID=3365526 RepID=UPI00371A7B28